MNEDPVKDITPDDSLVPVYLDPTPIEGADEIPDFTAMAEAQIVARDAGIAKLVTLGLTEAEARALAGGGA